MAQKRQPRAMWTDARCTSYLLTGSVAQSSQIRCTLAWPVKQEMALLGTAEQGLLDWHVHVVVTASRPTTRPACSVLSTQARLFCTLNPSPAPLYPKPKPTCACSVLKGTCLSNAAPNCFRKPCARCSMLAAAACKPGAKSGSNSRQSHKSSPRRA